MSCPAAADGCRDRIDSAPEVEEFEQIFAVLGMTIDPFRDRDGGTVVMVTHDPVGASYADRVLLLADGRVADDRPAAGVEEIAERLGRPAGIVPC